MPSGQKPKAGLIRTIHQRICEPEQQSVLGETTKQTIRLYLVCSYRWKVCASTVYRELSLTWGASDTGRASLIAIFWYMSKYPAHADKIRKELNSVDRIHDVNALAALPHLNAVISEALRLLPPVLTGNGRITGPNGLMIDGTWIPPNIKIHAPKYVISRREYATFTLLCF